MRQFLKRFLPPIVVDVLRRRSLSSGAKFRYTWEGIYPHLRAVPVGADTAFGQKNAPADADDSVKAIKTTYENDSQVGKFRKWVELALQQIREGETPASPWHEVLALVVATASRTSNRIRVLDYGGGCGLGFVQVLATLRGTAVIEYHVVELARMAAAGREVFAAEPRIQFHTSLDSAPNSVDIVYMSSVLPYIEDYTGLLHQLAARNPQYIVLTQLASGLFPTYATRQVNLRGHILPYWFINIEELMGFLSATGYFLIYEAHAGPEYDQSNFPPINRVGKMRNLIFVQREREPR